MAAYRIFTDATADMPGFSTAGLPPVVTIPMQVEVNGQEFIYGPDGDLSVNMFYQMQRSGKFAHTTQVSPSVYFEYFTPYLCQGIDILYLCFSSGMSGTFQSANLCMEELKHEYPERTILCIDTLCASVGEGFLVWEAARKQAEGASLSELAAWVSEHRLQVCHWFTVDTFEHLRHGGRVSSAAAVMGTALQIKPLLYVDEQGCLQVKQKLRGRKKAIAEQLSGSGCRNWASRFLLDTAMICRPPSSSGRRSLPVFQRQKSPLPTSGRSSALTPDPACLP